MWLYQEAKSHLRWVLSISNKIRKNAPISILLMVVGTLASQLTLMLASLLPLKIILLIGSPGVPYYFPQFLTDIDHRTLIVGLGLSTVVLYLTHLVAEKLTAFCNDHATTRVLQNASKLTLFMNQEDMARGAIRKVARGMANTIFVVTAIGLITCIQPGVVLVLLGWGLLLIFGLSIAGAASPKLLSWITVNNSSVVGSISSLGSFAVVGYMIAEFLYGASFQILYAIVSIILTRQVLQLLATTLKESIALNSQKHQINALFFHSYPLAKRAPDASADLWNLCTADSLADWLVPFVSEATGTLPVDVRITSWMETSQPDVLAFRFSALASGENDDSYLIKLFGSSRRMQAAQEHVLLASINSSSFPALPLLGARRIGEVQCHLLRELAGRQLQPKEIKNEALKFLQACSIQEPPTELVRRYQRSHQLLFERLSSQMGDRLLCLAVTSEEKNLVLSFMELIPVIKARIKAMPHFIFCHDANADTLLQLSSGGIVCAEWGRWTVEPVGAGWPITSTTLSVIEPWIQEARNKRPVLNSTSSEQVRLAALTYAFERFYSRQRYLSALGILSSLVACVTSHLDPVHPSRKAMQLEASTSITGS